jgi:hypothetical protein
VKKAFRTFLVLAVSAMYCLLLSVHGNHMAWNSFEAGSDTEYFSAYDSQDLLSHIPQSERTTVHQSTSFSSLKISLSEFSGCLKTAEQLVVVAFSQNRFYSRHVLTRLQNTDLIFPFHYFW